MSKSIVKEGTKDAPFRAIRAAQVVLGLPALISCNALLGIEPPAPIDASTGPAEADVSKHDAPGDVHLDGGSDVGEWISDGCSTPCSDVPPPEGGLPDANQPDANLPDTAGEAMVDVRSPPEAGCDGACGADAGCEGGRSLCAVGCVDLSSDVNNCGMCDFKCPFVTGGVAFCKAGACSAYKITSIEQAVNPSVFAGDGGAPFRLTCPRNEVVIGLRGVGSDAVYGLGASCGRIDLSQTSNGYSTNVVPTGTLPIVGGNIAGPPPTFTVDCPAQSVMTDVAGTTWMPDTWPETLKMISWNCSQVTVNAARELVIGPSIATRMAGIDTITLHTFSTPCPPSAAVNGFAGRSGAFLDALAVSCATLAVVAP
jgi:hypothetical protein